jgi:type IV pilus assembly protein PilA
MGVVRRVRRDDAGFTLIELLVVVIIIGVLAAIAIPAYFHQRQRARDAASKNDLRQVAHLLESYYVDNQTYGAKAALDAAGLSAKISSKSAVVMIQRNADSFCLAALSSDGSPAPSSQSGLSSRVIWWYDSAAGGVQDRGTPIVGNSGCPQTVGWSGDWFASIWISPDF